VKKYLTFVPILLIAIAILIFYFSGIKKHLSFQMIKDYHEYWKILANEYPFLSAVSFIAILTLSVCFLLPNNILLGIIAGFLFPLPLAVLYIGIAETLGAYLFYEAMGIAFVPPLHKNKKSFFWKLEKKVQANQISYLLFFRFTHLIPFFLLNTAAACFEVKRWTFIWTTFVGILPVSYIIAEAGSGLDAFFETSTRFSLHAILNEKVKLALLLFGILSLIPILWKIIKRKKN
jgi:uncharacterized membrane protein YdjX (TVP38/TMEM64 family)